METLVTKFDLPAPLVHALRRERVLDFLPSVPGPVTAIVAPAGFGKSSILAAWVSSIAMPTASVRLDEADRDPSRFGRHIADSIGHAVGGALPRGVHGALSAAGSLNAANRVTPLLNYLAAEPDVHLVLDDYHRASSPDIDEIMRYLIGNAPASLRVCLTSRILPDLGLKRLEGSGRLTELKSSDLALDEDEVAELLNRISGVSVSADEANAVRAATEGWPVLVALLAHSAATSGRTVADVLDIASHELSEYVLEEVLRGLDEPTTEFVKLTSLFEQLSGPLADVVTGGAGGGAMLEKLRRSGFPIDQAAGSPGWYRFHQQVGETLQAQLVNTATTSEIETYHRKAARWFEGEAMTGQALHHAIAGSDHDLAARIVADEWLARVNDGELSTVRRWLTQLPQKVTGGHSILLLATAWTDLMVGDVDRVSSSLALARELDPGDTVFPGASSQAAGILLIEALYYRIIGRLSDACSAGEAALELEVDPSSIGRARALTYLGICRFWSGDFEHASRLLNHGAGVGERFGDRMVRLFALGYLGLIEAERKTTDELAVIVADAKSLIDDGNLHLHPTAAPALAASGLYHGLLGDTDTALHELDRALAVASIQSEPGLLAYLNLASARLFDSMGQSEAAHRRRQLADALCRQAEDIGFIAARCGSSPSREQVATEVSLTARETSVLMLLGSRLSLPEVASELFVSHNTVKTHVQSLYRKLGVSRREDAVRVAATLGLS